MAETADTPIAGDAGSEPEGISAEEDWAAAIAASPPSARVLATGPAQSGWLRFRDRALERAYLQFEFERSKKVIVIGLAIGTVVLVAFLWVDPLLYAPEHLRVVTETRLSVAIPSALIGLVGAIVLKDVRAWIPLSAFLDVIGGCWPGALLLLTNGAIYEECTMGVWNIMIVTFFLCGLPLRWSTAASLLFGAFFVACSILVHASAKDIAHFSMNFLIVFLFSAFATYRYERATRLQFVAQGMSQILAARQLEAEADRRKWLEVFAAFLRHELNNAMTAISSSVDMAERAVERTRLAELLARARHSTLFMRRLLARVAEATSLESALLQRNLVRLNLTELVRDRMLDFQEDHAVPFETSFEQDLYVRGAADALTQMLEKLVNNAMEHSADGMPICVELRREADACSLTVLNQGDALPDNVERLFRPFVSNKARRSRDANLGLGLFVARTIAMHHGGSLSAAPLRDGRNGARFSVSLPLEPNQ